MKKKHFCVAIISFLRSFLWIYFNASSGYGVYWLLKLLRPAVPL